MQFKEECKEIYCIMFSDMKHHVEYYRPPNNEHRGEMRNSTSTRNGIEESRGTKELDVFIKIEGGCIFFTILNRPYKQKKIMLEESAAWKSTLPLILHTSAKERAEMLTILSNVIVTKVLREILPNSPKRKVKSCVYGAKMETT